MVQHLKYVQLTVTDQLFLGRDSRLRYRTATGQEMMATGAALVRLASLSSRNALITANTTLRQNVHEGRTLVLQASAATAVDLPAATGSGAVYKFIVGQVNTAGYQIRSATGADLMRGTILQTNSSASGALRGWSPGGTSDTIVLDGTTTGGAAVGDYIELQDLALNRWAVRGSITCTGTAATPYADTVA